MIRWRTVLAVSVTVLGTACSDQPYSRIFSGPIMGTSYQITAVAVPGHIEPAQLEADLIEAMRSVNARMSTYQDDSELSRFNHSRGADWFAVSLDLATVVAEARRYGEISGGAFDVTVGPLVNLWGFGPDPARDSVPDAAAIDKARSRVGFRLVESRLDPPALRKLKPDVYVDLSAIAKGYAVDQVCERLEAHGVENYLVDIGGDLRARGVNDRNTPWGIGIETPRAGQRSVQEVVRITRSAVATSGDYRNYFERDGKRYSHTIDPRSGRPVTHALASASVLADTAMAADALATTMMVLGPERGLDLARHLDIGVLLIVRDGDGFSERYTPKFASLLEEPGGSRSPD